MNICFFLLIITLFGLAALTGFNLHVLLLLGVTCVLWGAMMWSANQCVISPVSDMQVRHGAHKGHKQTR